MISKEMYRQNHFSVLTTYPQTTPRKGTDSGDFFLNTQSQNQHSRPEQSKAALFLGKTSKKFASDVRMSQEDSIQQKISSICLLS